MPAYGRFAQSSVQMWLFCTLATSGDALYISMIEVPLFQVSVLSLATFWLVKQATKI